MTDTPAPEAPAAPITEDSAHAGHDRPVPTGGRDSTDEGRKLVIASAYGAPDADEWVADARRMGVTVMRLTDIVETGLEDCLSDPEGKYEEMDLKARTAADAGMGVVLDLSFIRNAAIRAGRNPYKEDFDWSTYVAPLLARPFPTGGTYGTSEHIVYVSLPGEPHVDWGDDPNEKADTAEDLIAFYQRLARVVRRAGVDRPVAAGGFIHHTADGNGTDAGLDITAVYSLIEIDVCTTHAYDQDSLNALPMLTRYAHALGKPFILEETGRNAEGHSDAGRADWFARVRKACADAGVDGVGVWNVGQGGGFDVRPPRHPLAAAAMRRMADVVIPEALVAQEEEGLEPHGQHAATADSAASAVSAASAGTPDEGTSGDAAVAEGGAATARAAVAEGTPGGAAGRRDVVAPGEVASASGEPDASDARPDPATADSADGFGAGAAAGVTLTDGDQPGAVRAEDVTAHTSPSRLDAAGVPESASPGEAPRATTADEPDDDGARVQGVLASDADPGEGDEAGDAGTGEPSDTSDAAGAPSADAEPPEGPAARRWPAPSPSIEGLPLLRGRPPPPRGAAGLRLRPSLRRVPMPPRPRLLGEPSPAAGRKPPFGEALWLHGTRRRFMASGAGARRSPMRAGRPRTPPSRAPSHVRMPTPTAVMAGPPHAALPRRPTNRSTRARVSPPTPIGGRTPLRTRTAGTEAPLRGPGRRGICAPAGRPAGA